MKKVNKFYRWFTSHGGNVAVFETAVIFNKLNQPEFLISSLKNRAQEIKELYNHKFN